MGVTGLLSEAVHLVKVARNLSMALICSPMEVAAYFLTQISGLLRATPGVAEALP